MWAVALLTPLMHAQFNTSGVVPDWYNQAMPGSWNSTNPALGGTSNPTASSSTLAPTTTGVQNWKLGVYKRDLDVGTLVERIEPNSPAERAGLKKDDLIVTINGAQVGNTPTNGYVDVGLQASQSAINGRIVALIADGRTGELRNVTINLEPTTLPLTGTIRLSSLVTLPNSYLTLTLKNLSRPLYEVVGGKLSATVNGSGPFDFKMMLDPRSIQNGDRFQLQAQIEDTRGVIQYYATQEIDTNRLLSSTLPAQILNLETYQQWIARNNPNAGQVIQASYVNQMESLFQTILGRPPNAAERDGWSRFLQEGNTLNDMRIRLISHATFYDRVGNNPSSFVNQMILILAGRPATAEEVRQWTARLGQLQGYREMLVREYIQTASGQLR